MILAVADTTERRWAWRLTAAALILAAAALRIAYLLFDCPLDLAPDEAHYWDWSRHLDWSYYSKGPLVALLIRGSCEIFGNTLFAVRFPAVVCGSLFLVSLYVLTVQVHGRERWALATVGIALTLPLIAAGSILMTIDAPFICAWGWALVFGYHALFRDSSWAWVATGLCVLVGVLAKHTMVLWVPMAGLFLLTTPAKRHLLWSPRFWIMTGIGSLGGVPILLWNMQNDWVTLKHTRNHAGLDDTLGWMGPLRYLGMQFAVLLGFWFVGWARAAWVHHPGREERAELRYLWWLSVPMIAFFLAFSVRNGGGEANWPVAGYISGMVLMVGWLARDLRDAGRVQQRLAMAGIVITCVAGLALTLAMHEPAVAQPLLMRLAGPPSEANPAPLRRIDPTCRLRGWSDVATQLDEIRKRHGDALLVCDSWILPGEFGFYCVGHPQLLSLGPVFGERHSQYELWHPNPVTDAGAFAGATMLVIGSNLDALRAEFSSVEHVGLLKHVENGHVLAAWPVTLGRGYRGFAAPVNGVF
jgi:4-amino-4-deoxy-L-arabinose transferase-like glycosyltransferase